MLERSQALRVKTDYSLLLIGERLLSTISFPSSREYHVTKGVAKRELVSSSLVV